MPVLVLTTAIRAPIEIVFDLSRDIDFHTRSTPGTNERAVAGVTSGLIGVEQEVTWEATHFFVRQRLTSRITGFARPRWFRDSMVRGAFARFDHDHHYEERDGMTTMRDVFDYTAPFGLAGHVADWLFLERYMRRLLGRRAELIRDAAESGSQQVDMARIAP